MNDSDKPRSLKDDPEATPMLLGLLDQARREEGLDVPAVERLVARVDALGPVPAKAPPSIHKALVFVGVSVAVVALLTAAFFLTQVESPPTQPAQPVEPREPQGELEVHAPEVEVPEVEVPEVEVPEVEAPEVEAPEVEGPLAQPSRDVNEGSEGALLLAARRALLSANPTRALALTREHERRFAEGAMEEEREVIAMEALLRVGQTERAEARRARFNTRHPSSPYRSRVDALFAQTTP